jgi:hypothetical protein
MELDRHLVNVEGKYCSEAAVAEVVNDRLQVTIVATIVQVVRGSLGKYAPATSVEELTALLTGLEWPIRSHLRFTRRLYRQWALLSSIIEPAAAREAFVHATHAAGMLVFRDEMADIKKRRGNHTPGTLGFFKPNKVPDSLPEDRVKGRSSLCMMRFEPITRSNP